METSGLAGGVCSQLLTSEEMAGLTIMLRALTLGSLTCMLSLHLSTSKPWIWSLYQPISSPLFLVMEYISWGDLSTPLEAKGRVTEAEVRGPGGITGGSAHHRLAGVALPGPCSPMDAAKHQLKYLCWQGSALAFCLVNLLSHRIYISAPGTAP